jgi:hypothetical protein
MKAPNAKPNDKKKAGEKASKTVLFGEFSRYAVYAVHTRFSSVVWFVTDAETDPTTMPQVIRQAETFEAAIKGLA